MPIYSITSSARPSSVSGKLRPSALAAFRLITSSTFVDCWTGRSGLLTFENAADIDAREAITGRKANSVAHQATSGDKLAHFRNCRKRMACRECAKLNGVAMATKQWFATEDESPRLQLDECRESPVEVAFARGVHDVKL